jgi:hypothetical protein
MTGKDFVRVVVVVVAVVVVAVVVVIVVVVVALVAFRASFPILLPPLPLRIFGRLRTSAVAGDVKGNMFKIHRFVSPSALSASRL